VYQKVVTYDVEKITRVILEQLPEDYEFTERQTKAAQNVAKSIPKLKAVKLRKTLQLQEATEALEEREPEPAAATEGATVVVTEPVVEAESKTEQTVEDIKKIKQRQTKKKQVTQEATAELASATPATATAKKTTITRKKKNVDFDVL
jgi:hypothetical protein